MMFRLVKKRSFRSPEAVEDSFGNLNSFIRDDQIFWVFWADLEKLGLNFWATEDMLWRQLNIKGNLSNDLCNFFVR
ncbi:hypothetical protein TNCV_2746331 [Trichonephila clavipes]|nr:hypothetical protein TNCV_2746331 [Trichonephila clavipes]